MCARTDASAHRPGWCPAAGHRFSLLSPHTGQTSAPQQAWLPFLVPHAYSLPAASPAQLRPCSLQLPARQAGPSSPQRPNDTPVPAVRVSVPAVHPARPVHPAPLPDTSSASGPVHRARTNPGNPGPWLARTAALTVAWARVVPGGPTTPVSPGHLPRTCGVCRAWSAPTKSKVQAAPVSSTCAAHESPLSHRVCPGARPLP